MKQKYHSIHCKKRYRFPVPSRDVTKQALSWPGIINLFPARESLVSDIPDGDGKIHIRFIHVHILRYLLVFKVEFAAQSF